MPTITRAKFSPSLIVCPSYFHSKYILEYETEQSSRSNYTRECKPEDRVRHILLRSENRYSSRMVVRGVDFPRRRDSFEREKDAQQMISKQKNDYVETLFRYGYATRAPCLLILLKDASFSLSIQNLNFRGLAGFLNLRTIPVIPLPTTSRSNAPLSVFVLLN